MTTGTADWTAIGTGVRLAVTDVAALPRARALLASQLAEIDEACSRFRADSELVRLDLARGRPVRVSRLLADAVAVALDAAARTGGDVDPTLGGPLADLGYDRDYALLPLDGPAPRVRLRTVEDWRSIELDRDRGLLQVPQGVRLDLGATAKAFAADRAAATVASECGCGVLVALGGDIATAGPAPDSGWVVRVQDCPGRPEQRAEGPLATVAIIGGGLATSSTAARRWRRGGQWLHHLLDPRTGRPAATRWRTVTVAAATCVDANVASTAAVIRGDRALPWLTAQVLPARLVAHDGSVLTVAGWPALEEVRA